MDIKGTAIAMSLGLANRSFVLVMQDFGKSSYPHSAWGKEGPYGGNQPRPNISFHPREHQPCWGELRKYELDYPGKCTEPSKVKPSDLHWPFPEGKPIGLATCINTNKTGNSLANAAYEAFFDPKVSPWAPGLTNKIEFIRDKDKNIIGIWTPDLHVDPTVFVNLLRKNYLIISQYHLFNQYVEEGLTPNEAITLIHLGQYGNAPGPEAAIGRYLHRMPRDLSGGYMDEGIDYNRTQQDEIFFPGPGYESADYNTIYKKCKLFPAGGSYNPVPPKELCKKMKDVFAAVREFEKPTRPLHIWKRSDGTTNGPTKTVKQEKKVA